MKTDTAGGFLLRSSHTTTLTNTTISDNSVPTTGNYGSNLKVEQSTVTLVNSTVYSTAAGPSMRVDAGPMVTLRSTLLANNGAGFNCGAPTASTPYTSNGNNLSSDNSCSPFFINSPGDDPHNASAPLGPLADNGGNTFTRALLPGSLAVDAGSNAGCPNIDHRGTARPYDGNGDAVAVCDIGAYETITTTLTNMLSVTKTGSGTGSVSTADSTINCGPTCTFQSHSYPTGTVVTLSASPESGSTFTGWSGGGCSGAGTCIVSVTTATSIVATFDLSTPTYLLTVAKAGAGTGTVSSSPGSIICTSVCSESFASGTSVTLIATGCGGPVFNATWDAPECSGASDTCTFTMTAARSVTATFP